MLSVTEFQREEGIGTNIYTKPAKQGVGWGGGGGCERDCRLQQVSEASVLPVIGSPTVKLKKLYIDIIKCEICTWGSFSI